MSLKLGAATFDVSLEEDGTALVLASAERPRITLRENGVAIPALRAGALPEEMLAFLAGFLAREEEALAEARRETARQLWDEYAGSWREAGHTDVADFATFVAALGNAEIAFYVGEDWGVSMAELVWANRDLFLGHTIFTQVYEPEAWRMFDATIFG